MLLIFNSAVAFFFKVLKMKQNNKSIFYKWHKLGVISSACCVGKKA